MLIGKHRCWRQHGRLLPFHHSFESSAHCHFGFAVTDVAAKQSIHRRRLFHILLHILDRRFLIWSQDVFEAIFKLALPGGVCGESITTNKLALSIQTQKLVGHIAHGPLGFGFCFLPTETAESIQTGLLSFRARITLHQIQPLDRNIKLRILRVEEQHKLAAARAQIQRLQTAKTSDAVVYVDHEVAGFEIAEVGKKRRRLGPSFSAFCLLPSAFRPRRAALQRLCTCLVKQVSFNVRQETGCRHLKTAAEPTDRHDRLGDG